MVCAVGGTARSATAGVGQAGLALEALPGPHAPNCYLTDCPLADASDLQGRQLLAGLDKVASDLDRQEKAITGLLRPPLEQGRAVQDSAERAKELKVPTGLGSSCTPWRSEARAQGLSHTGLLVLDGDHLPHLRRIPSSWWGAVLGLKPRRYLSPGVPPKTTPGDGSGEARAASAWLEPGKGCM